MTSWGRLVAMAVLAAAASGCSTATWSLQRPDRVELGPQDAVAVLLVRAPESQYSRVQESDVTACIESALKEKYPTVRLVAADEVRRSAFAGAEPEAIPSDSAFWETFLAQTESLGRLAPLGLRFLIPVTVVEEEGPARGVVRSVQGPMLVGVVREWDVWSRMKADILDLTQARRAGTVESTGHGQSYFGVGIGYLPAPIIPLPSASFAYPEGPACRELGNGVRAFFTGETPPPPRLRPVKVEREKLTLAAVETEMAQLIQGPAPFEARFKELSLTEEEVPRLRDLVKQAVAAAPGSELKCTGVAAGAKYEVKMRKDKTGRAAVSFEGFAFASAQQMEEFLAPFAPAASVRLEGRVAGRQVKISRGR
jgi:hypothetical protein